MVTTSLFCLIVNVGQQLDESGQVSSSFGRIGFAERKPAKAPYLGGHIIGVESASERHVPKLGALQLSVAATGGDGNQWGRKGTLLGNLFRINAQRY
jgi:hypothetical protein